MQRSVRLLPDLAKSKSSSVTSATPRTLRCRAGPSCSAAPSTFRPAETLLRREFSLVSTRRAPETTSEENPFAPLIHKRSAPGSDEDPSSTASSSSPDPSSSQSTPVRKPIFRTKLPPRIVVPPPADPLLSYFTNLLMRHGKKHQAARVVAETLNGIHVLTHSPPLPILRQAVELASPEVRMQKRRQGAKDILTPQPLTMKQRTGAALRWMIRASESRPDYLLEQRLAKEIMAVINGNSDALKKKEEVHKVAIANRGNAAIRL